MKRIGICAAAALCVVALVGADSLANQFANSGFEDPITSDGPPFVGSWEGFQGSGASASNSSAMPLSGAMHVDLTIDNTPNTFAGVFQDVPNLTPGDTWTFSGWHKTPSDPLDLGVEVRIEWRDSVADAEVSRTANLTPVPSSDYTAFSLTAEVPAGADLARPVYAIQSFSTNPLGNGTVYIDDFSFVVPEPTAMTLLALGGSGLVVFRRRGRPRNTPAA